MPALGCELEMVGRARSPQHHAVEPVMIVEAVEHAEPQPVLIEAQQRFEIVGREGRLAGSEPGSWRASLSPNFCHGHRRSTLDRVPGPRRRNWTKYRDQVFLIAMAA